MVKLASFIKGRVKLVNSSIKKVVVIFLIFFAKNLTIPDCLVPEKIYFSFV